jgi:hypothetical protein
VFECVKAARGSLADGGNLASCSVLKILAERWHGEGAQGGIFSHVATKNVVSVAMGPGFVMCGVGFRTWGSVDTQVPISKKVRIAFAPQETLNASKKSKISALPTLLSRHSKYVKGRESADEIKMCSVKSCPLTSRPRGHDCELSFTQSRSINDLLKRKKRPSNAVSALQF